LCPLYEVAGERGKEKLNYKMCIMKIITLITLQQDGIQKVMKGITATEEVSRVTRTLKHTKDIDYIIIET